MGDIYVRLLVHRSGSDWNANYWIIWILLMWVTSWLLLQCHRVVFGSHAKNYWTEIDIFSMHSFSLFYIAQYHKLRIWLSGLCNLYARDIPDLWPHIGSGKTPEKIEKKLLQGEKVKKLQESHRGGSLSWKPPSGWYYRNILSWLSIYSRVSLCLFMLNAHISGWLSTACLRRTCFKRWVWTYKYSQLATQLLMDIIMNAAFPKY